MKSSEPSQIDRAVIAEQLAKLIADWGAAEASELRELLQDRLARLDEERLTELITRIQVTGADWGYNPGDPFVRELSRHVMGLVLREDSSIDGASRLRDCAGRPVVLLGNHLSFVDANVFDALCSRAGEAQDQLVTVVGPKVYSRPIRRLASLCFGTIKTPQSSTLASGEALMSPREVARLASRTLRVAERRLEAGDTLLVFPEGSRSRTGAMRRFLPAVSRYLTRPDALLVPWAHTGSERLVPLEEDRVYAGTVRVRIGQPVPIQALLERCGNNRPLLMDAAGFLVAALLPGSYRGFYTMPPPEGELALRQAYEIALELAARDPSSFHDFSSSRGGAPSAPEASR